MKGIFRYALVAALLLIPALAAAQIEKPRNDERHYLPVVLENGLSALLISDPDAETAGAAVSIAVGSDDDPADIPGLAHLLEHMVFSGSADYPERGGFTHFISQQGGMYNGYTAPDQTAIMFQVQPTALEASLDRFADFLASPLLAPGSVDEEVAIIQHEYEGTSRQQGWEELSAFRKGLNSAHPFTRFNMGNAESFSAVERITLQTELEQLFEAGYTAENMKLVVLGTESVDTLKHWVSERFAEVAASSKKQRDVPEPLPDLLGDQKGPLEVKVSGHGQMPRLIMSFPVRPAHESPDVMPWRYIANLLTSREAGRLRDRLLSSGLISELGVTSRVQTGNYATFDVILALTEAGQADIDAVISNVLAYLDAIRDHGVRKEIYAEQQRTAAEQFHNQEPLPTFHYVAHLASVLQRYSADDVLTGPGLMERFEPSVIRNVLSGLVPGNMIVTISQPGQTLARHDPYSDARFEVSQIPLKSVSRWNAPGSDIAFTINSGANPYVQAKHELAARGPTRALPTLLTGKASGFEVWFKQDDLFNSPRGAIFVALEQPVAGDNAEATVLRMLYAQLANEALSALNQLGSEAGLEAHVYPSSQGVGVRIYGFTGKQPRILEDALRTLKKLEISEEALRKARAHLERYLDQYQDQQPAQKLMTLLKTDLVPGMRGPETQLQVARTVSTEAMKEFHEKLWKRPAVTSLIHGNYTEGEARRIAADLKNWLGGDFRDDLELLTPVFEVPGGIISTQEDVGDVTAVTVYLRRSLDPADAAPLTLLSQMLNEHMFRAVREDQAKGYMAFATVMEDYQHRGIVAGVQAPGMAADAVEQFIQAELKSFVDGLASLSEADFNQYREGVRNQLRASQQRLSLRSLYWWMDLRFTRSPVDEARIAEAALDELSRKDLLAFARMLILDDGASQLTRMTSG